MTSPDINIYGDEQRKLQMAYDKICRQFEFSNIKSDVDKSIFEMAVHNEFGEAGFRVEVTWSEIYSQAPGDAFPCPTGIWEPGIEIVGRNKREEETDHDRMRWGVVKGLADGVAGYVREDGTYREDPIKKIIT